MHIQAFVSKTAVERLDERIVRRLSGPRELHHNAIGIGPKIDQATDEFTAVIAVNPLRSVTYWKRIKWSFCYMPTTGTQSNTLYSTNFG